MIVYRCDISGRDLTAEQVSKCTQKKLEFARSRNYTDWMYGVICDVNFSWHEDYDSKMEEYWLDRESVVQELLQQWDARIQNHRKAFFKPSKKVKASHESEVSIRPS